MKIYITKYKTLCTKETKVLGDLVYPQRVHWMSELYARVKTGLSYVRMKWLIAWPPKKW